MSNNSSLAGHPLITQDTEISWPRPKRSDLILGFLQLSKFFKIIHAQILYEANCIVQASSALVWGRVGKAKIECISSWRFEH